MQYVLCRRICGITLLLSLLCSILFLSPQASACSRGYEPSLEDDYLEAASIFTGKVIKVERIYFEGTLSKQVTFELNRLYKGQFGSVLTNMESDQCGATFIQGATYLVFARSDGDHLHTSTFGVYLFSQSTERIDWLDKRMQKTKEIHKAGTEKINVQRKGIKVQVDNQLLPSDSRLFLYEHTVFVPSDYLTTLLGYQVIWKPQQKQLDIFSPKVDIHKGSPVSESQTERQKKISEPVTLSVTFDRIQLHVNGVEQKNRMEPFLYSNQVYVPIRTIAEQTGFNVNWDNEDSTVILRNKIVLKDDAPLLTMKFSVTEGMEADYLVDKLTDRSVTYRYYDCKHQKEPSKTTKTLPFEQMVREQAGIKANGIRFFLKTNAREVELKLSEAFVNKLETDPVFRKKVGLRLGKPLATIPGDLLLTIEEIK